MKENSLKLAQQDVEDALNAIEFLEKGLDDDTVCKDALKEKFMTLSKKVQELETILKDEGII